MISIREVQWYEEEAARQVMLEVCNELWGDTEADTLRYDPLLDYHTLPESYREKKGLFLVVVDDGKIVGSGAVRQYQGDIAEIKRLWLLKAYRSRGLGRAVMEQLIAFAREAGYRRIWLEVGTPEIQPEAIGLYHSLGFHTIPAYAHAECELGMEKILDA